MADRLTNLQNSLDQLATQMFASLRYISARHSLAPIPHQPFHGEQDSTTPAPATAPSVNHYQLQNQTQPTTVESNSQSQAQQQQQQADLQQPTQQNAHVEFEEAPRPDTPRTFAAALEELAQDLVSKEREIEGLIANLPGRGRSRADQEARLRELDNELRAVESEVASARQERQELTARVDEVIWSLKRW